MLNIHTLLADAGTAVGAATGIAALLRIDELWLMLRNRTALVSEILRLRTDKRDALTKIDEQHRGMVAVEDSLRGLKIEVADLTKTVGSLRDNHDRLSGRLGKLEPAFDGAIAYIHALTAYAIRLLRALKANRIEIGVDENLPKPPDVLLEYVPETHRPD